MTNLWFVNEDYPATCKSKICGQWPGRECIFTANASICSAKNARNDVHAVISDLSLVLPILCQCSVLGGYAQLRAYDKLAHMLSGSFVYLLAHPLFYFLKANHAVEKSDRNLLMVFCAATSLCVAGLWEIGEYFLSMLTGIDMQRVATMGIHDSMQDMIVCLIGTVALLPSTSRYFRRGVPGIFMRPFDEFLHKNAIFTSHLRDA